MGDDSAFFSFLDSTNNLIQMDNGEVTFNYNIIKDGWLTKSGHLKRKKQRYCLLLHGSSSHQLLLLYFTDNRLTEYRGCANFGCIRSIKNRDECSFQVITPNRTWEFTTSNPEQAESWISMLLQPYKREQVHREGISGCVQIIQSTYNKIEKQSYWSLYVPGVKRGQMILFDIKGYAYENINLLEWKHTISLTGTLVQCNVRNRHQLIIRGNESYTFQLLNRNQTSQWFQHLTQIEVDKSSRMRMNSLPFDQLRRQFFNTMMSLHERQALLDFADDPMINLAEFKRILQEKGIDFEPYNDKDIQLLRSYLSEE